MSPNHAKNKSLHTNVSSQLCFIFGFKAKKK